MKFLLIGAIIFAGLYLLFRYFSLKRDHEDKGALEKAYLEKDFDKYLLIVNYRIEQAKEIKDKNILATLKMPIYLQQRDWEKVDALYKQVDLKKVPKKTKLTFLCHYITALFLSGRPDTANAFVAKNKQLLKEGAENSRYQIYLDGFKAYQSFYQGNFDAAEKAFLDLKKNKVNNDFYQSIYDEYLTKIEALKK